MVSDDELRPYFDAIAAAVDDDEPRLRLAAFLEQRGDARAESIRIGCAVARMERDDPQLAVLDGRLAQLPKFTYFGPAPAWHRGYSWARGFIDGVNWSVEQFVAHGAELCEAAPVRSLDVLFGVGGKGHQLAACPALAKLRKLTFFAGSDVPDLLAIATSPYLTQLPELALQNLQLSAPVMAQLDDARNFPGLRVLHLHWCRVDADVWPRVLQFAERRKLDLLDVDSSGISAPNLELLQRSLGHRVRPAPPPARDLTPTGLAARTRFGRLDVRALAPTADEWRGILARGPYEQVTELTLPRLGDAGVVELARSGMFPALLTLNAAGAELGARGIAALADATGLAALEVLELGEGLCERHPRGVPDDAVTLLARSPALRSLRRIERSREWHAYGPGAREGEEVTTITRGDKAKLVEDAVYHSIWP
ncbi:MAG: hypothetical protein IPL61_30830 [Myxococcales bacterium]|nr:hypothetical protein [Myxococcales bacterium]